MLTVCPEAAATSAAAAASRLQVLSAADIPGSKDAEMPRGQLAYDDNVRITPRTV